MSPRKYEHPPVPIMRVLQKVIRQVRQDDMLSDALDGYVATHPDSDNVAVRWLSQKRGYEVTLKFTAEGLAALAPDGSPAGAGVRPKDSVPGSVAAGSGEE